MKDNTHPKWYPDAKVIVEGEVVMTVGSTKPQIVVEVSPTAPTRRRSPICATG